MADATELGTGRRLGAVVKNDDGDIHVLMEAGGLLRRGQRIRWSQRSGSPFGADEQFEGEVVGLVFGPEEQPEPIGSWRAGGMPEP